MVKASLVLRMTAGAAHFRQVKGVETLIGGKKDSGVARQGGGGGEPLWRTCKLL